MVLNLTSTIGTILHLQRLSTEDGPGIRTTVFFKGCPLRCAWCHNPESISPRPQVQWLESRCIGCQSCLEACPRHGLVRNSGGEIARDRAACTACGECSEACPSGAMELLGTRVEAATLAKELLKDNAYFMASAGGVTLSGGEPTLQPEFAAELSQRLRQAGVAVALDTCGLCPPQVLERLLPWVDLVLFDLKCIDPAEHLRWTGAANPLILDNLRRVRDLIAGGRDTQGTPTGSPSGRKALWIRTPLIPGATVNEPNLRGIGNYLARELDGSVERWELCAFNNLCREQYRRLGLTWAFAGQPLMTRAELAQAGEWARSSAFDPARIFVTGAVRVED